MRRTRRALRSGRWPGQRSLPFHRHHQCTRIAGHAQTASGALDLPPRMQLRCLVWCATLVFSTWSRGQAPHSGEYYAPLNSVAGFAEYSNSSSHIILGDDRQRKFAGLALAYQRRISATHWMAWDYSVEVRPILVESDPTLDGQRITVISGGKTTVSD